MLGKVTGKVDRGGSVKVEGKDGREGSWEGRRKEEDGKRKKREARIKTAGGRRRKE